MTYLDVPQCTEHHGAWASFMHVCTPCLKYGYAFQFNERASLLEMFIILRKHGHGNAIEAAARELDASRKPQLI